MRDRADNRRGSGRARPAVGVGEELQSGRAGMCVCVCVCAWGVVKRAKVGARWVQTVCGVNGRVWAGEVARETALAEATTGRQRAPTV